MCVCVNFLLLRVFRLLSSSLLLFPQCFDRYVLRPSSGVCRTQEPVLIPLAITRYKVLSIPVLLLACSQD